MTGAAVRGLLVLACTGLVAFGSGCVSPSGTDAPDGKKPALLFGYFARDGQVRLWWPSVRGAQAYAVYRKAPGEEAFTKVTEVPARRVDFRAVAGDCPTRGCQFAVRAVFAGNREGPTAGEVLLKKPEKPPAKSRSAGDPKPRSNWSTTHWDGETAPRSVRLLLVRGWKRLTATLTVEPEMPEVFADAVEEGGLITGPRFRMEVFADNPRLAGLEVTRANGQERSFLLSRVD